jgi:hypothetical protein
MIKAEKAAFKSSERQNGKERGISMTHKIKMIGLDLDGTLLTDKKELTVRTREVLAKAIRSGIVVLVATVDGSSGRIERISGYELCADV